MKKASDFISEIVEAATAEQAIKILKELYNVVNPPSDYESLFKIKTMLQEYSKDLIKISKPLEDNLLTYEELSDIRKDLNFFFRNLSDELTNVVAFNKLYTEEVKTQIRGESLQRLQNSQVAKDFNIKSTNALRDVLGLDSKYQQYIKENALAYANYKTLEGLLNSTIKMIDLVASRERREQIILQRDVK